MVKTAPATWHTVTIKAIGPTVDVAINDRAVGSYAIQTFAGLKRVA